ncbi:MAG: hypothetical protein JWQ14_3500 [Adhaeribacter sp.]|nr:hypothetical protein [Adhaeribacter sp.]
MGMYLEEMVLNKYLNLGRSGFSSMFANHKSFTEVL